MSSKYSTPKRHHYLPQFYLERFTKDGSLWVYDRERKEYRSQTPINTAVITHYYKFIEENGTPNVGLEAMLAEVEGETKNLIAKLEQLFPLTNPEQCTFALFVALLRDRVPHFEKEVAEIFDVTYKEITRDGFSTEEKTREVIAAIEKETGEPFDVDPELLMEVAKNGNYTVEIERIHSLAIMFPLAYKLAEVILYMDWSFLFAPPSASFITTDKPFTIVSPVIKNSLEYGFHLGGGIDIPGTQKYIPLSQKLCLCIQDRGTRREWRILTDYDVRAINFFLAKTSEKLLISADENLLRSVVTDARINAKHRHKPTSKRK